MAVRGTISTWTSVFTVTCLFLWVKDVDCSECSELASLLETPFILPCQTTTTYVTGSSVVFDFYDSASLTVDSCSCSVTIPSTSNFRLSMSAYQGLGIVSDPGCGSQIEVNNSRPELLTMVCQVFGSLSMNTGDNAVVKLIREQNADSRYCMMMNTDPRFIMDISCQAVGSPSSSTTSSTTRIKTTTLPTTTTTTPTTTTPTTTTPTTTTPTTTTPLTTTTPTTTTPITTTPITTTPKTSTPTTTTPTTTTPTTTTPKPATTTTATTTKSTTETSQPSSSTATSVQFSETSSLSSLSATSKTTPPTAGGNFGGQEPENTDANLVIIIPVVVGLFVLLVLLLVVKQLVSTYRTKKQRHEPDREKLKFGSTFPKMGIFQHPTEMMETTHYNSNEDLHGQTNRYTSVTNPVYVHEESEYLPDLTEVL